MATNPIPTFRELVISGHSAALNQLVERLPDFLPATWQRDQESEAKAQGMGIDGGEYRCYAFEGNQELPMATLWLFVEAEKAQVVNIVAPSVVELGYERYNAILAQFADAVAKEIVETGVAVEVAPWQEPTLEGVLQPEPAQLFRKFAKIANPMTGTLHPADGARWQDFLISAHRHHVKPDEELLRRWLKAECQWPEQTIDRTLDELQPSLDLLQKYEQTLPPVPYANVA